LRKEGCCNTNEQFIRNSLLSLAIYSHRFFSIERLPALFLRSGQAFVLLFRHKKTLQFITREKMKDFFIVFREITSSNIAESTNAVLFFARVYFCCHPSGRCPLVSG
jgi:hypothetical protein